MGNISPELLKLIADGGNYIFWILATYFMFRYFTKQQEEKDKRLYENFDQDLKYKELLVGILTRLEIKIDMLTQERKLK